MLLFTMCLGSHCSRLYVEPIKQGLVKEHIFEPQTTRAVVAERTDWYVIFHQLGRLLFVRCAFTVKHLANVENLARFHVH